MQCRPSSGCELVGRLDGKVAIITGAARGQGAAEAELFVAEGARVVLGDILTEVHDVAERLGDQAIAVDLDVTKEEDWSTAVGAAETFGRLDVLINNAGITWQRPLEHENAEDFRRILDINLIGPFLGTQAVLEPMRAAGGGSIVNIVSTAGLTGLPYHGAYGASKWGLRGMTRVAAVELGPDQIRVNGIYPGPILTDMLPPPKGDVTEDTRFARLPLGRAGEADEVAQLALYLASDDSSFQTGGEYTIDGGSTAGPRPSYVWQPPADPATSSK